MACAYWLEQASISGRIAEASERARVFKTGVQ